MSNEDKILAILERQEIVLADIQSRVENLEGCNTRLSVAQTKIMGDVHTIKHQIDDLYNHFKYAFEDIGMLDVRTKSLRSAL